MSNVKAAFTEVGENVNTLMRGRIDVNNMEAAIEAILLKESNLARIKQYVQGEVSGNPDTIDYSRYTDDGKVTLTEPHFIFDFAEASDSIFKSRGGGALCVMRNLLREKPDSSLLKGVDPVTGKRWLAAYNPDPRNSTMGCNPVVMGLDLTTKAKDVITMVFPMKLDLMYVYAIFWLAAACRYYPDENRMSMVGVTGSAFANAYKSDGVTNDLTKFVFNRQMSNTSPTMAITINNKPVTMNTVYEADKWYIVKIKQTWRGDVSILSAANGNGTSSAKVGEGMTFFINGESDEETNKRVETLMQEYGITE